MSFYTESVINDMPSIIGNNLCIAMGAGAFNGTYTSANGTTNTILKSECIISSFKTVPKNDAIEIKQFFQRLSIALQR